MEGAGPQLEGCFEKRCLPKGLELEKKPLPRLVPIKHVLFEAFPNHLLKINPSLGLATKAKACKGASQV